MYFSSIPISESLTKYSFDYHQYRWISLHRSNNYYTEILHRIRAIPRCDNICTFHQPHPLGLHLRAFILFTDFSYSINPIKIIITPFESIPFTRAIFLYNNPDMLRKHKAHTYAVILMRPHKFFWASLSSVQLIVALHGK